MSEHTVPAGKLCPFISTAQVLLSKIQFVSEQKQSKAAVSLQGIQGIGNASMPAEYEASGQAVAIHANPVFQDGTDTTKPIEASQIKSYKGQPLSVPCIQSKCAKWCEAHGAAACGGGCNECALEVMTKAMTAALATQGEALGLAAAGRLLNKAHESFEETTQEEVKI